MVPAGSFSNIVDISFVSTIYLYICNYVYNVYYNWQVDLHVWYICFSINFRPRGPLAVPLKGEARGYCICGMDLKTKTKTKRNSLKTDRDTNNDWSTYLIGQLSTKIEHECAQMFRMSSQIVNINYQMENQYLRLKYQWQSHFFTRINKGFGDRITLNVKVYTLYSTMKLKYDIYSVLETINRILNLKPKQNKAMKKFLLFVYGWSSWVVMWCQHQSVWQ